MLRLKKNRVNRKFNNTHRNGIFFKNFLKYVNVYLIYQHKNLVNIQPFVKPKNEFQIYVEKSTL